MPLSAEWFAIHERTIDDYSNGIQRLRVIFRLTLLSLGAPSH
jgi:hypothetical protein